jgi:hypothetical protein
VEVFVKKMLALVFLVSMFAGLVYAQAPAKTVPVVPGATLPGAASTTPAKTDTAAPVLPTPIPELPLVKLQLLNAQRTNVEMSLQIAQDAITKGLAERKRLEEEWNKAITPWIKEGFNPDLQTGIYSVATPVKK